MINQKLPKSPEKKQDLIESHDSPASPYSCKSPYSKELPDFSESPYVAQIVKLVNSNQI